VAGAAYEEYAVVAGAAYAMETGAAYAVVTGACCIMGYDGIKGGNSIKGCTSGATGTCSGSSALGVDFFLVFFFTGFFPPAAMPPTAPMQQQHKHPRRSHCQIGK